MNSVGDIGGNFGSELDSVVGSALFLKLFPKLAKTGRFQVIYTLDISYFLEFDLDI